MNWSMDDIETWHEETFPDATLEGQLIKLEEELKELDEATEGDEVMKEASDVLIVCAGLRRWNSMVGKTFEELFLIEENEVLQTFINAKMEKNKARIWAKTAEGTYHHTNKE